MMPAEPHYFRTSELTQKPVVVQDISSSFVIVVPDVPAQAAILRLFVNDEGNIDKVLIEDSHLPEHAERRIRDAFSRIRFQPGKIGRQAVRSQFRIEVLLEEVKADLAAAPA